MSLIAELLELKQRVAYFERLFESEPRPTYRAGKRLWSPEDDAFLRMYYPHESTQTLAKVLNRTLSSVLGRANNLGLGKTKAFLASLAANSRLSAAGAAFRFGKGHVPANKGLRRPGYSPGRMRETQFKRGVRSGVAVKLYQPIGAERTSKEGYLERKVNDDLPLQRRWKAVHRIIWEEANGPVPPHHIIAFKNKDKGDRRLDNLECVSRREWIARHTVHNLPPELKNTVMLLGALKRQINRRKHVQEN